MIDDAGDNTCGNAQFFRYAADTSCRGRLLSSSGCLEFRRGLLRPSAQYAHGTKDPYVACRAISAC